MRQWTTLAVLVICLCALVPCTAQAASIKLNKSNVLLKEEETYTLKLKNVKAGVKIKWKSSDQTIATVSSKGKVTAVSEGETYVTATANKRKYKCKVSVSKNFAKIFEYQVKYHEITINKVKNFSDSQMVIPSEIDGYPVTALSDSIFADFNGLERVVIPEGIAELPDNAFSGCKKLTSVKAEGTITRIGENCFKNCHSLTEVPDMNAIREVPDMAFYECNSIDISIPTDISFIGEKAFYNCDAIRLLIIPSSVKSIGDYAFYDCDGVHSAMILSVTEDSQLEQVGNFVMAECDNLMSVNFASGKKIQRYGNGCFYNCKSLVSVTLTGSATWIGDDFFYNCENLSTIHLPDYLGSIPKRCFYNCYKLNNITLPYMVSNIESQAFFNCFNYSPNGGSTIYILSSELISSSNDAFLGVPVSRVMVYYQNDKIGDWASKIGFNKIKF